MRKDAVNFLLVQNLDGYVFNPHLPNGIDFSDEGAGFRISIRSDREGFDQLKIRSQVSLKCNEKAYDFIDALIERKFLETYDSGISLPFSKNGQELISVDGRIAKGYGLRLEMLPDELQVLSVQARNFLEEKTKRFVTLLRWQQNAVGPADIGYNRGDRGALYWKTTQEQFHVVPFPRNKSITLEIGDGALLWADAERERFRDIWSKDEAAEPLGRELLLEARQAQRTSDRSALLIAYSALEVGLKQHISSIVPASTWLVKNAPTPPIAKIIKTYLPELYSENEDFKNWPKLRKRLALLDRFTDDRNRLAHRGEAITGDIEEYVELVSDLLYAFDVFEGNQWAKMKISPWFANIMGWDGADYIQVTISHD